MKINLFVYQSYRELNDYEKVINLPRVLTLSILITILAAILLLVGRIIVGVEENWGMLVSISITLLISVGMYFVNRNGYHTLAGWWMVATVGGAITYNLIRFNGIYDVGILGLPAVVVFASILFGRRSVVAATVIACAALGLVYVFSLIGYTVPFTILENTSFQDFLTDLVFLVMTGYLVYMIMGMIAENISRVLDSERELQTAYENTLQGWSRALELRDHETLGHSKRVTELTASLAERFGVDQDALKQIRYGALLHDIGKMGIPDQILLKPGKLTDEEFEIVKEHPDIAVRLLQGIPYLDRALVIPQAHHERFDGSGYPEGLSGEDIPLEARIFSVVDVFDALISERPYSSAWKVEEAVGYIRSQSGILFDPAVVKEFLKLV